MLRSPDRSGCVDRRRAEFGGNQMGGAQAIHVLAQQRVVVDRVAQLHGVLDLPLDQFRALQRDLTAAQIQ